MVFHLANTFLVLHSIDSVLLSDAGEFRAVSDLAQRHSQPRHNLQSRYLCTFSYSRTLYDVAAPEIRD